MIVIRFDRRLEGYGWGGCQEGYSDSMTKQEFLSFIDSNVDNYRTYFVHTEDPEIVNELERMFEEKRARDYKKQLKFEAIVVIIFLLVSAALIIGYVKWKKK